MLSFVDGLSHANYVVLKRVGDVVSVAEVERFGEVNIVHDAQEASLLGISISQE
jgi:hypothetical protein